MPEKKDLPNLPPDPMLQTLSKTRSILLSGEVNKDLAEKIVKQLLWLESDDASAPIYIFIDSPGGDVDAGFAIYDMIRFVKPKVFLIGMGLVASAAALIILAVPAERRLALPNSRYLLHQPLSGMRGYSIEIEIHAAEIIKLRKRLNELIAKATDHDVASVESNTDRDYWLNSDEALDYKLVSKIIASREELEKFVG